MRILPRDHRAYVGGEGKMWDRIGRLQFAFLKEQGLEPHHVLVDVACGSLRAGVHIIPYLEPGNYLGIDIEPELIQCGIDKELDKTIYATKRPEFVVSGVFEFRKFSKRPHYGIAQSLFTHLIASDIDLCMNSLREFMLPGGRFFVTFFRSDNAVANPGMSDPHARFQYTIHQMESFGTKFGWGVEYVGDWGHPRGQEMICYKNPEE